MDASDGELLRPPVPAPVGAGWALFVMLLVRGLALWVVVPLGVLLWAIACPFLLRKGVSLAALLGWADLNLLALLQRGPLRPWMRHRLEWVPASQMSHVEHRLRWFDPV